MSDLTVNIQTPSGFEVQGALIPDNITVEQVIAELLGGLSLPRAANGQPINYSLVLVNRGLVLRGDQTLQDGGVQYGDTIRLVTSVEPSNGSQAPRAADAGRNGGSSSAGDPAWPAASTAGSQPGQAVPPPVVVPPVAAPVAHNDWPRDAGSVANNDWRSEVAAVVDSDWPHDRAAVANNDWPGNGAPAVTGCWQNEAQTSPGFAPAEESSHAFAMADVSRAGADETKDSTLALTHIVIDGGWTPSELSEWLGKLELAYCRLNAFLCLSDEDITRAGFVTDGKSGSGSLDAAFSLLVAAGNRRSSSLKISRIDFAAEGEIDLTGEQPPIKIMTEIINEWRQQNLSAGNGLQSDHGKPATEAATALVRRAEQLSGQEPGVFVEGFIHHALDTAREALEGMAKDIRIKKVSWSSGVGRP